MIGLVLIAHGKLASELVSIMEHIVGRQEYIETVSIGPDDDVEKRREEIIQKTTAVDQGKGVILLTDMFGGTPSNLAISTMAKNKVEVVAGVNLPMLIKLTSIRGFKSLEETAAQATESGRKHINVASYILRLGKD